MKLLGRDIKSIQQKIDIRKEEHINKLNDILNLKEEHEELEEQIEFVYNKENKIKKEKKM